MKKAITTAVAGIVVSSSGATLSSIEVIGSKVRVTAEFAAEKARGE